jgi:hypothetical protein
MTKRRAGYKPAPTDRQEKIRSVGVEDFFEGAGDRGVVRIGFHDIGHISPPFFHDGMSGQVVVSIIIRQFLEGEQSAGIFIQINGIIADAGGFEQPGQFRPNLVMPFAVFEFEAGFDALQIEYW